MKPINPELRKRIISFNIERAADREKAADFMTLLSALPKGQIKQLFKDETCAAILSKYGITESE